VSSCTVCKITPRISTIYLSFMELLPNSDECGSSMKRRQTLNARPVKRRVAICPSSEGSVGNLVSLTTQSSHALKHDKKVFSIGCGSNCDIVVKDLPFVSSKHCLIHVKSGAESSFSVIFEDCSTNGSYVNNSLVFKGEVELKYGDHIDLHSGEPSSERVSFLFTAPDVATSRSEDDPPVNKRNRTNDILPASSSSSSSTSPSITTSPSIVSNVEEKLQCVICQEIIYKAATAVPCMHSYCGGCISSWHKKSPSCPLCNTRIAQVSRNHTLDSLVDDVLKVRPGLCKSAADRAELDAKDTIKYGARFKRDEDYDDDDEDDEDEDEDSDDDGGDGGGGAHIQHPPAVALRQQDVDNFKAITGCSDATARQILTGTVQRNLNPILDYALTYYYENN
jgi:pSer/pThr/pTyr-binding forkhead associated (FHA) protein